MQVLKRSSSDFLSPLLVLQKMKEDYFSRLDDYNSHSVNKNTNMSLVCLFVEIQIL